MRPAIFPHRVLALYPKSRPVQRLILEPKFARELVVVVRKNVERSTLVEAFVENILF